MSESQFAPRVHRRKFCLNLRSGASPNPTVFAKVMHHRRMCGLDFSTGARKTRPYGSGVRSVNRNNVNQNRAAGGNLPVQPSDIPVTVRAKCDFTSPPQAEFTEGIECHMQPRYDCVRSKLHVVQNSSPPEALGPGITFIKDESGWSAESRARRLGFIEDEYLVLAPHA